MSPKTTFIDGGELFNNFHDFNRIMNGRDGSEVSWTWPGEIGTGSMYMIKLKTGLVLGIGDYRLIENIAVSFSYNFPAIVFSYALSGVMNYAVNHGDSKKNIKGYQPGHSIITYLPQWSGVAVPPAGIPVSCVGIYIDPLLCRSLMAGEHDRVPAGMRDIINGDNEQFYYQVSTTPPATNMVIQQILDCPYQGSLKRLYLESKVLELITHSLAHLAPFLNVSPKKPSLLPHEVERVQYAGKLVESNLQNPPKLLDLAKTVGMSHPKLNICFRELYGTTVFGYLRQTRLGRAKSLFDTGRMNVTEVAYEVGYSSLSHFARAFRKQHGISPGSYLCRVKSKW